MGSDKVEQAREHVRNRKVCPFRESSSCSPKCMMVARDTESGLLVCSVGAFFASKLVYGSGHHAIELVNSLVYIEE